MIKQKIGLSIQGMAPILYGFKVQIYYYYYQGLQMQSRQNSGKRIQNYVFNFADCIGKGNFSTVYKAYHEVTNEVFAIKIIQLSSLKSKKLEELLFSQIQVLKKLNHPNVLKCYEVFTSNRHCYIITQLCNEGDLETKLRKQHTFTQSEAQPIVRDILAGLLYLSSIKIVHRDLKVANIFLHKGQAKIADFGFAKFTDEKWNDVNIGSPIYMSPEGFIDNIYGPKTDVWALGVLLYELFHGQTPFSRCKTQAELKSNIVIPIHWGRLKPDLSAEIKQVILRCMEVSQEKRCGFNELKYTPYFRRLMGGSKVTTDTNWNLNGRKSDLVKPESVQELQLYFQQKSRNHVQVNRSDKMLSPQTIRKTNLSPMFRSQSPQRMMIGSHFKMNSNTNLTKKENVKQQHQRSYNEKALNKVKSTIFNILISTTISFKECVNILHYCRLIYKFITCSPSETILVKTLKAFLINCLGEISSKIQSKGIFYQGENIWLREKKLREVTEQYSKKYKKQLGISTLPIQTSLSSIKQSCHTEHLRFYEKINQQKSDSNLILMGICILVIWHSTRVLQKCFEDNNYSKFGSYKQIETLLNKTKNGVSYEQYKEYNQRIGS